MADTIKVKQVRSTNGAKQDQGQAPSRPSASGRSTVFTSFPTTHLSAE